MPEVVFSGLTFDALNRISATPSSFRISRSGVDVLTPPSTTSAHLAMNSDWGSVERRHEIAIVKNTFLVPARTISLIDPLDEAPLAVLITRRPGTLTLLDTKTHASSYWDSFGNQFFKRTVREDTHVISHTTRSSVVLSQKDRNIAVNDASHSEVSGIDEVKYDFIVLIFKRGD
jgi:hypothetical protein